MSSNRAVVAAFSVAVVGALGVVAWLVLGTAPPAEKPVGPAPKPIPVKDLATPKNPGPRKEPRSMERQPGEKPPRIDWAVHGLVRVADGTPVADADVVVYAAVPSDQRLAPAPAGAEKVAPDVLREMFSLDPDDLERTIPYSGVPALPAGAPAVPEREVARGKSGADGTFRIPVRSRGPFRVDARKEGVGQAIAVNALALDPRHPDVKTELLLTLGSSATLAGRVVSSAGAAVDGAVVVLRSGAFSRGATAGADGGFSFGDLIPGTYVVDAGAPGFAPTQVAALEVPAASPVEIVLGSGYAARVTVSKREIPPPPQPGQPRPTGAQMLAGTPLEGALVVLYHRQSRTYRSATTGPDGVARIERLGPGKWLLAARREGFMVGLGKEISFRVGSPPEESRDVKMFALVPTPVVVLDEAGGPVRGAKVYTGGMDVEFDERHSVLVGKTDADGRIQYAFDDGIPWKGVLWVVPEEGGSVVKVEPDDPLTGEEVKAVVRPGRIVQGTVTDQRGRPLKGAQVLANVTNDEPEVDVGLYVYTDDKGAYRFPSLPFGDLSLEVDMDGEWDTQDVDGEVKENPLVRDFKLEIEEKEK